MSGASLGRWKILQDVEIRIGKSNSLFICSKAMLSKCPLYLRWLARIPPGRSGRLSAHGSCHALQKMRTVTREALPASPRTVHLHAFAFGSRFSQREGLLFVCTEEAPTTSQTQGSPQGRETAFAGAWSLGAGGPPRRRGAAQSPGPGRHSSRGHAAGACPCTRYECV